jgi:hemerythrin-like domain-containing protein
MRIDEPLEKLQSCHVRIETYLAMLERLAAHVAEQGSDAAARDAARFVIRFFDTTGEQHHHDEDHDLFPRLRERAGALARPEIAAVIDELEREHATMHLQWSRLRAALDALAHGVDAALAPEDVTAFAGLYRRHMERETAAVLPFAREVLDASERAAFGERMAGRRKGVATL